MILYAIQTKVKGKWQFGPKLYGMDTLTGLVGPYFMNYEAAISTKKELERYIEPKNIRLVEAEVRIPEDE